MKEEIKIILFILLILTGLFGVLLSISADSDKTFRLVSSHELAELQSIYNNLSVPSSFIKIRESKLQKSGSAVYDTQYSTTSDNLTIKKHFIDSLVPQGWKYSQENEFGEESLFFEKDRYSVAIHCQTWSLTTDKKCQISCSLGIRN